MPLIATGAAFDDNLLSCLTIFPPQATGPLKAIFEHAQEESGLHAAEHPELDRKVIAVL